MGHKYQGRKSDVWSCGVILFAMAAGLEKKKKEKRKKRKKRKKKEKRTLLITSLSTSFSLLQENSLLMMKIFDVSSQK